MFLFDLLSLFFCHFPIVIHFVFTVTAVTAVDTAPVVSAPFCPPGLELILDSGQLVIHKDNLRLNEG